LRFRKRVSNGVASRRSQRSRTSASIASDSAHPFSCSSTALTGQPERWRALELPGTKES